MTPTGKRLTLVTALFDLATREQNNQRRTPSDYFVAARRVLALDENMVVFADPDLCDTIAGKRRRGGHEARTLVVPTRLEELPAHAELGRIEAARHANPLRNGDLDVDTPLYTVVQWAKFDLMERAIAEDPFGASHFAWIDFGLAARSPDPADQVFSDPGDGIRLAQMRRIDPADLADRAAYAAYLRGYMGANYMAGTRERFEALIRLFRDQATSLLDEGLALSEEQILPLLWAAEPELFDPLPGDYDDVLRNYRRLRGSAHNLVFQMREARDAGDREYADRIAQAAFASHEAGTLECSPAELAELLDECYLAAWYAPSDPGHERAARIASAYLDLAEQDPDFRDVFLRHEVRVRSNFALLEWEGESP
jgi:hypothetical protein